MNLGHLFRHKSSYGHMLSFLLGKHLGVELLDPMLNLLRNFHTVFQSSPTILHSHQQYASGQSLDSSPAFGVVIIFYFSHSGRCVAIPDFMPECSGKWKRKGCRFYIGWNKWRGGRQEQILWCGPQRGGAKRRAVAESPGADKRGNLCAVRRQDKPGSHQ